MKTVIYQAWEESESGWGVKPDGFSLHLTLDDHKKYLANHARQLMSTYGPNAPDVYERPSGSVKQVEVPAALVKKISGLGRKFDDREYEFKTVFTLRKRQ